MATRVRARITLLALLGATLLGLSAPRTAQAKAYRVLAYPSPLVFGAAMRFLRVDRGYDVVEKDAEAGYVIFRFPVKGSTRPAQASLELTAKLPQDWRAPLKTAEGEAPKVAPLPLDRYDTVLILDVADLPEYLLKVLLDDLEQKIAKEQAARS